MRKLSDRLFTLFSFFCSPPVPFPFTDRSTTEKRPAIVISSQIYQQEGIDLIIIAITS